MASLFRPAARLGPSLLKQSRPVVAAAHRFSSDLVFTFASPGEAFYNNAKIKQADVPTSISMIGVLPDHVPCLATLQPGVMTIYEEDGAIKKYWVSSGSFTMNADSTCQVLAEEAFPLDAFDVQAIRDGLTQAQNDLPKAPSEKEKAEAQIAIDTYQELLKVVSA